MGRTPTRFKQHRVTTTRPMNCYAVSTRLRRSRHLFLSLPSGRGQPLVTRSPDYTGMWVRLGSTDIMAGKVMFLLSNQGGRLDGNESVADSFRSDLVGFKSWSA
ncbi:hypothetical protein TNCV_1613711 [Trichonephila clavipes]|nr:hypothetical protein TNCV_1613711 [Trichonephila clavipes]